MYFSNRFFTIIWLKMVAQLKRKNIFFVNFRIFGKWQHREILQKIAKK